MKNILTLVLFIFSLCSFSQVNKICSKNLDDMPTQAGGRIKPLFVHAKESLKFLFDKTSHNDLNASEIYCHLSLEGFGIKNDFNFPVKVEHVKTQEFLQLKDKTIPVKTLMQKVEIIKNEFMVQKENNAYKKELNKLLQKAELYDSIVKSADWKVFNQGKWLPLYDFLTEDKIIALKAQNVDEPFLALFNEAKNEYDKTQGTKYLLELTYVKSHIFGYALALVLIGITLLVLIKKPTAGIIVAVLTLLLQVAGITMRVMISGRAPITNMYETVMFSGFGALFIGTIITSFKKDKIFVLAGLAYNFLCLLMMMFANNMLNSAISPLVPVLRDNFWLSTHVTMVILSYAALALSWIISNITLVRSNFFSISKEDFRYNVELAYTCIKVGVVMLAAGIILGGVWADYSWGRFWGWDPKETWSLIVLLVYMAILHGKSTSWIDAKKFNFYVSGAFMSVMMAWFGVNYILASGLHSYGFSEGGAIFLVSLFTIQTALLIFSYLTGKEKVLL